MGINTVSDIIRVHGAGRSEHPALIQGDRRRSWGELLARAGQVANGLVAAGVGSQDRIAFLDKNGVEHFEVFYGAALLNAVCVDVNWRLAPPEVEYIVNDAEAKVLVVGHEFVPVLDAIAANLTTVSTIIVIAPAGGEPSATHRDYESWVASFPATDPGTPSTSEDLSLIHI